MRNIGIPLLLLCFIMPPLCAEPIRHRLVAIDESRDSLLYVNENDSSADWSVHINTNTSWKSSDIQLVGRNRIMIPFSSGYEEYDLATGAKLKTVSISGLYPIKDARRLPDGTTILMSSYKVTFYRVDSLGKILKSVLVKDLPVNSDVRTFRITRQGTYLFGSGTGIRDLIEADSNGVILHRVTIPGADVFSNVFQAKQMADKSILISGGYGAFMTLLDSSWTTFKTVAGGKPGPVEYRYNFFAGFQALPNRHLIVSNWLGHGFDDGATGIGLIEYDSTGSIVWSWMDHARVSSLNTVVVLDSLNTNVLNDEMDGILAQVEEPSGTGILSSSQDAFVPCSAAITAWPNPFSSEVGIRFRHAANEVPVKIEIFNSAGMRVMVWQPISSRDMEPLIWNGQKQGGGHAPSGVYFCRLRAGGLSTSTKLILQ